MMRLTAVLLALSAVPASSQEIYDLLLKGGHVIDPKNRRNGTLDIAISSGKIRKIASSIPTAHARRVVGLSDYYVTPGLIDINAHLSLRTTPAGVNPDHNTLRFGVTTAVDAGSSGPKDFEQFKTEVIDGADVRVLAFLNFAGEADATTQVIRKYPQLVLGITTDPASFGQAVKVAESTKTVVMTDGLPAHARAGDIYTHAYGRTTSQGDSQKRIAAQKEGVFFDVGHGSDSLWFRIAIPAIKQGFLPDTISTGMDSRSVMLPRATMTNVMSKFLAMGLTLDQIIERSTINPAKAIKRPDLGSIEEGGVADVAVFELAKGKFAFLDSGHAKLTADRQLRCVLTIRNGEVVWDTEGLSLTDWKNAGPYTNFK